MCFPYLKSILTITAQLLVEAKNRMHTSNPSPKSSVFSTGSFVTGGKGLLSVVATGYE